MMASETRFDAARARMVETQLARRGITDPRVLAAMGKVPRECFVPSELADRAYDDGALPIGHGQTISQPYIVALMIQALALEGGERVLDIGTGSGYAAAVLAEIAGAVIGVERDPALARDARARLQALRYENVEVVEGDGSLGWPEKAPYDAVIVAAGAPTIPAALAEQLRTGGRLVLPVGEHENLQRLECCRKGPGGRLDCETIADVRFVPLVGKQGWRRPGEG